MSAPVRDTVRVCRRQGGASGAGLGDDDAARERRVAHVILGDEQRRDRSFLHRGVRSIVSRRGMPAAPASASARFGRKELLPRRQAARWRR